MRNREEINERWEKLGWGQPDGKQEKKDPKDIARELIGTKMYCVDYSDRTPPADEIGVHGVNCCKAQNLIKLDYFVRMSDDGEKVVLRTHQIKFNDITSPYEITRWEEEISCFLAIALDVASKMTGFDGKRIGDEQYDAAVKAFKEKDYEKFYNVINYWHRYM